MCLQNRYLIGLVQLLVLTCSHVVVRQSDASRKVTDDDSLLVETTHGTFLTEQLNEVLIIKLTVFLSSEIRM